MCRKYQHIPFLNSLFPSHAGIKLFFKYISLSRLSIQYIPDSNLSVRIRITYNFSHLLNFEKLSVCDLYSQHNVERLRNKADKSICATGLLEEELSVNRHKNNYGRENYYPKREIVYFVFVYSFLFSKLLF